MFANEMPNGKNLLLNRIDCDSVRHFEFDLKDFPLPPDDKKEYELVVDYDNHTFSFIEKYIPPKIPTPQDDTDALLLDYEYRITMLELGVTDNGE